MAMTLISTVTVGSGGASEMVFSSIPDTYTDLVLKTSVRMSGSVNTYENLRIRFNGTTSGYSDRLLFGFNNSPGTNSLSGQTFFILLIYGTTNANTTNTFGNGELYIPNYAGATNKTVSSDSVNENNATNGGLINIGAGVLANTAAITSINLSSAVTILENSTASLYGITKGSGGATVS